MGALVHSQITLEGGAAAKTATFNTPDLVNYDGRGIELTLDITAASGTTPTLDVKIQGKDEVSDTYTDIPGAAFTQKTAAGDDKLTIYPGIAVVANESVNLPCPGTIRAVCTIGGTTPSFTFTLAGYFLI
jgi:hypothetical protein